MATYPAAVRAFTPHQDFVEYIDASHVNALQEEVGALERTVGVQPQVYAPAGQGATTYTTVASRLDSHETELAALQTQISSLQSASNSGWQTPVMSLECTSVVPVVRITDPVSFVPSPQRPIPWNLKIFDTSTMWSGGPNSTCSKGGLWQIAVSFTGALDYTGLNATQTAFNALQVNPTPVAEQRINLTLIVNNVPVASDNSTITWGPQGSLNQGHNINFVWNGSMSTGQIFYVESGQFNGTVSGIAAISATYLRALPGVS